MRLYLSALLTLTLSGCAYVPVAIDRAAAANDEAVTSAEWVICKGASIGSIRRAYGDRPEVWAQLCKENAVGEFAGE